MKRGGGGVRGRVERAELGCNEVEKELGGSNCRLGGGWKDGLGLTEGGGGQRRVEL